MKLSVAPIIIKQPWDLSILLNIKIWEEDNSVPYNKIYLALLNFMKQNQITPHQFELATKSSGNLNWKTLDLAKAFNILRENLPMSLVWNIVRNLKDEVTN